MQFTTSTLVQADAGRVWALVSDIEDSSSTLKGVQAVQILERPEAGLVGLKWKETRTLFGKPAVATMWIAECIPGESYRTSSEEQGATYSKLVAVKGTPEGTRLSITFKAAPRTVGARIMTFLLAPIMQTVGRKALERDLADFKAKAEAGTPSAAGPQLTPRRRIA